MLYCRKKTILVALSTVNFVTGHEKSCHM